MLVLARFSRYRKKHIPGFVTTVSQTCDPLTAVNFIAFWFIFQRHNTVSGLLSKSVMHVASKPSNQSANPECVCR